MGTPGAYFSFEKMNYWVPVGGGMLTNIPLLNKLPGFRKPQLQLLKDVSGYVKPGMNLALMGASGAGKSTLLDVIGQRKTVGKIKGNILINGHKIDKFFNRMVGYVEQSDIHIPTQTVREALQLSAMVTLSVYFQLLKHSNHFLIPYSVGCLLQSRGSTNWNMLNRSSSSSGCNLSLRSL